MFKEGDSYIRFTKYGSVIIGTVKNVGETYVLDTEHKVRYIKKYIITNSGIPINLDGSDGQVYRVTEDLSEERVEALKAFARLSKQEKTQLIFKKYEQKTRPKES